MSHYYLAPYLGAGTDDDPYRPTDATGWAAIDLRGDPTQQAGWCLLRGDGPLSIPDGVDLGDDLDDAMPRRVSRGLEDRLGLVLDSRQRLREIIVELLLRHATPIGDTSRWNRLQTNSKGRHRIAIGGEVVYDAPAIVAVLVTDDFNRADEDIQDSANWDIVAASNQFSIVSNVLNVIGTTNFRHTAWWSADSFGPDCYAEFENLVVPTSASGVGPMVRYDGVNLNSTGNAYFGRADASGPEYDIFKVVTGSSTQLATGGTPVTGTYRFEADGSTLTLFVDTVQELQTTDTSITGADFAGIFQFGTADGGDWDDFEAADLAAAAVYPPFPRRPNRRVRM